MSSKTFQDKTYDFISFNSDWQQEQSVSSQSSQTNPIETEDSEFQSFGRSEIACQTAKSSDDLEFIGADWNRVNSFLLRVEPMVTKALKQNLRSKAFKYYEKTFAEEDVTVSNSHSLKHTVLPEDIQALMVEWNASGTTVAVACGYSHHEDWCTHKGYVCTWNIERRTLDPANADICLDMDSCATCIKFNPSQPGLIAVGTFNGEVIVFNLAYTEGNMTAAHSKTSDTGHKEPVSGLQWTLTKGSQDHTLVSCSYDGKILLWTIPARGQDLVLSGNYVITAGSLPRELRGKISNTGKESGVTAVAFSKKEPELFLAAGETGGIFHCNFNAKDPVSTYIGTTDLPIYSPVVLGLKPHQGPVYCVRESPFHRNLFLTCGADGSVRVYNILKIDPLVNADLGSGNCYSACWSPIRPLVFAAGLANGQIALFDLSHSEQSPLTRIDTTNNSSPVYSASFNPHKADILATGDAQGAVKIWRLGDRFSSQSSNEEKRLNELASRSAED